MKRSWGVFMPRENELPRPFLEAVSRLSRLSFRRDSTPQTAQPPPPSC